MTDFTDQLPEDWKDILPEDLKSNGVLSDVTSMSQMAKMAADGRTLANNALRIPSDDASDLDKKEFRADLMQKVPDLMFKPDMESDDSIKEVMMSLGMPKEVAGYELPELPEMIKGNIEGLAGKAHEAGLTKKQFAAIAQGISDDYKTNSDALAGRIEEDRGKLKQEWGSAFDEKVKGVAHFAKQTGFSEDFISAIQSGQVDSINMQAFDSVIKGYEGGAIEIGKQAGNVDAKITPAEAENKLDEIMGNKDHAYYDASSPVHDVAVKNVLDLVRSAEEGKKQSPVDEFRDALQGRG